MNEIMSSMPFSGFRAAAEDCILLLFMGDAWMITTPAYGLKYRSIICIK